MTTEIGRRTAGLPGAARVARLASPAVVLLAGAVLASGALLLALGSRLTFLLDDWEFLLYRPGFTADSILTPHNEHISVAPILIYKALLATVGMGSALPFRVASTIVFLIGAVLLFAYLRRRVGDWPALLGAAVILFLGAAWEDLLWSFQIGFMGSIACGIGMLLALEREDRAGDRLACLLLTISITFSSLGLPFAAGAAVEVGLRREGWRRRLYVVAIPVGLYALWWIGWGHTGDNSLSLHNVANTPSFLVDAVASAIASLLGLANSTVGGVAGGLEWGRPLLLAGLVFGGWRLYRIGHVPRSLWIVLAIAATFWILAGFNVTEGRTATASRYQLPGAIFVLMIAAELLRGLRVSRAALLVAFAVGVASVASNISFLHASYLSYRSTSDLERADLGAVEIARDTVSPTFVLSSDVAGTAYVNVDAGTFLSTADRYGSPADSPAEIAAAPEPARVAADRVLAAALGVGFRSVSGAPPASGASPHLIGPRGAHAVRAGSCLVVNAAGNPSPVLSVPAGGAIVHAGRASGATVSLRRFATESFPLYAGHLAPGAAGVLKIPTDRASQPWQIEVSSARPVKVCGGLGGTG